MYTYYIQSSKILASFCSWAGWLDLTWSKIPEDMFSRDVAHLKLTIGPCSRAQHTWLAQLKIFMKGRKTHMSRLMTTTNKMTCAQRRLWSVWADAWRKFWSLTTHWEHREDSGQTARIQIKGLVWLYNISLWYTIVKLNSTAVCEDKHVCGVKNFIILFLLKTNYLDLWLQALQ